MSSFLFLPSLTTTILLPSGTISTPSLNHLTSASSSSTSILNSTLSSSTQSTDLSSLVNLCCMSPMLTSQVVSSSPSLPNSTTLQVYLPESSFSAHLISSSWTPSLLVMRKLVSDGLIS